MTYTKDTHGPGLQVAVEMLEYWQRCAEVARNNSFNDSKRWDFHEAQSWGLMKARLLMESFIKSKVH